MVDIKNPIKIDEVTDDVQTMECTDAEEELFQTVLKTSQYFTSRVELLPGKFYLNQESQDDENNSKSRKKKKRKKKPDDKKLLAKKAKLLKLDPSQHRTILELQEEVESKEKELYSSLPTNNSTGIKPINISNVESTASLEELRERLHAKMDNLRGNRKLLPNNNNNNNDNRNHGKTKQEKKKINADKKKKQEESENIKRGNAVEKVAIGDAKDLKNDCGEVVFSKFDFATGVHKEAEKKKNNLKQLLKTAEKKQSKLELLQVTDVQKADELKMKISWDTAFQKAEGVKLKDNPKLLKKSIKRKEKQKEKSGKKWDDRIETVQKQKEERQQLRKQHLKEKREEKVNKKTGKKKKKKSKPGF